MADDSELNIKIQADTSGLVNAATGFRDIVAEQEAFEASAKAASHAAKQVSSSSELITSGMDEARVATAGATREFIVLGHEIVSGNFSRIPGSLMVLGERMGGLQLATVGVVATIAAVVYEPYELVASAERAEQYLASLSNQMDFAGRSYAVNTGLLEAQVQRLREMPGVSLKAAEGMVATANASRLTGDQIGLLIEHVELFSR